MKTTTAIQDKRNIITLKVKQGRDFLKPTMSGAGRHADRRLGRLKTRSNQLRQAMAE